jgi:hypothetical protein
MLWRYKHGHEFADLVRKNPSRLFSSLIPTLQIPFQKPLSMIVKMLLTLHLAL